MVEDLRLSMKGIWSHKLRSFLTMLGIIVGVAAVIAVVSTINGTNEQIKENLVGDGTNTVNIELYSDGYKADFTYSDVPQGIPVFDSDVLDEVKEISGVENATFIREREFSSEMFYKNTALNGSNLYGVDEDFWDTACLSILRGRGFSEKELRGQNKVAIIDKSVLNSAFSGKDPLGETLDIKGEPFTVIGVVDKRSDFEPVIKDETDYETYIGNQQGSVYIPNNMWPLLYAYDEPFNLLVRARSVDDMTYVGREAAKILNSYLSVGSGTNIKYQSTDMANEASQLQQLSSSTNALLIGIASISLLVGGIGVMNIMLVSVTERTREIGIKKALGARKSRIRRQFLTEAVLLSSFGGVLGVLAGILLSRIISMIAEIPVAISIPSVIIAVLFSMAIGVGFGMLPSVKASKLNPIEALGYE